jgi:hypothetical protein
MNKPKGITVILYERSESGTDGFNRPIYTETAVEVANVLIGEPSTDEITNEINLSGKRLAYTLAIPKGDSHVWTDRKVSFWGQTFHTIGEPTQGIEDLIPLSWNKKVKVERYGG